MMYNINNTLVNKCNIHVRCALILLLYTILLSPIGKELQNSEHCVDFDIFGRIL